MCLYARIFSDTRFFAINNITMAVVIIQTIACVAVISFQCLPVDSYWDMALSRHCIQSQVFVYVIAGLSIFEDFLIMLLPVWELKNVQIKIGKKIAVCLLLAVGSL